MIKYEELDTIDRKIRELNAKSKDIQDKMTIIIYLIEKLERQGKELEELLKEVK